VPPYRRWTVLRGPGGKFVCQNYDAAWRQLGCEALGIGFSAKNLAVNPRQNLDLMVVFVLGAIGSLIFITQKQLRQIIEGHGIKGSGATGYLSWYWFRPIFGVVIAFAIYLLYKTGAAALGSGTDSILAADVNLPMLALISLFAGLLSWHALDVIETRGRRWLDSQKREDLYASGLEAALRNADRSPSELAVQIARTPIQIDRWIAGRDKVTPEMQDRISTWLDRPRIELFSKDEIDETKKNEMRWATGLKRALDNADTSMDVEKLAVLLGRNPEIVEAWRDLRLQVEPAVQLQLAEALKMRPADLFDKDRPDTKWWAHGLRVALEDEKAAIRNAEDLALKVESSIESVHRYMELERPVPKSLQDSIASALDLTHSQLFTTKPPMAGDFMWASKLRSAMRGSRYKRAVELAEAVDTDVFRVRAWMEMEICEGDEPPPNCGQVAQATRKRIARELSVASEMIFRVERADGDFKWAVMPLFGDKVNKHGILAFAESLDVDKSRVECWMERTKPVAPETQLRIKEELGFAPDDEGLFEWVDTTETKLLEGEWWATNLRAAIRDQGLSVASLAGTIGGSEDELHGYVELEGPVPSQIRAKLANALGVLHEQIFVQDPPSPKKFFWAPYLRGKMAECGKTSADLAREIGGDVGRIRNWMEMDDGKILWRDDKDNQEKGGTLRGRPKPPDPYRNKRGTTSAKRVAKWTFSPLRTFSGTSSKSPRLSSGRMISLIPARRAAMSFSRTPPMGNTSPVSVISPVMAIRRTGRFRASESRAEAIVIPAEGPSLGVAPAGTWRWINAFSKN